MRRKRYLMAADSVISAIKMGSSCEASCCRRSNQWYRWQQPQRWQGEALQGVGQKSSPATKHKWWVCNFPPDGQLGEVTGALSSPKSVLGCEAIAWPPFISKCSETRPQGMMALLSRLKLLASQGGVSSPLTVNVSSDPPAQLFIILETPRGSKLALKIRLHF